LSAADFPEADFGPVPMGVELVSFGQFAEKATLHQPTNVGDAMMALGFCKLFPALRSSITPVLTDFTLKN
jgi:hypothetical protein